MSGLKTGVENDIFWSEIGSGFGEPGGTPPSRIPRSTPPGLEMRTNLARILHKKIDSEGNHVSREVTAVYKRYYRFIAKFTASW